jgi:glutamine---fructose-6-phosphate transaminase (isomerizing)
MFIRLQCSKFDLYLLQQRIAVAKVYVSIYNINHMLYIDNNNNNGMTSLYEINILNQPVEWNKLLNTPIPQDLNSISPKKIVFVGIGSSYWVSRFAELLWREYYMVNTTTPELLSVQSFDFVKSKYIVTHNDIVVVFSHRGTKTFSMKALEVAKKYGATTILITGIGSPSNNNADFRIETCTQENCGAFTISLTSAITRIVQWIGLYNIEFLEKFKETINILEKNLPFKIPLPNFPNNLVIVGDLIREIVAHEVALKISETSYLPVRSFGLEEFLHGPRITLDNKTSLVIFSSLRESRREGLINYAQTIGCEVLDIHEDIFDLPKEFGWLAQLLWGQQLALELSRDLKTNPDTARTDQHLYDEARKALTL